MVEKNGTMSPEERVLEVLARRSIIVRLLLGGSFGEKFSPTGAWLRMSAKERWQCRGAVICMLVAGNGLSSYIESGVFDILYMLLRVLLLLSAGICLVGFKRDFWKGCGDAEGRSLIVKLHWISNIGLIALLAVTLCLSVVIYRAYFFDSFSSVASLGVTLVVLPPLLVLLLLNYADPYYIPGPGSGYIPRIRVADFFGRLLKACLVAGLALLGLELAAPIIVGTDIGVNLRSKMLSYFAAWVLAFLKGVGKLDEDLQNRRHNLVEELCHFAYDRDVVESGDSGAGGCKWGIVNLFKFGSQRYSNGDKHDSRCSRTTGNARQLEKCERISRIVELSNRPVIRGIISAPLVPRVLVEAFIVTQFRCIFSEETLKTLPRFPKELTACPGDSSEYALCVRLLKEIDERSGKTGFMNSVLLEFSRLFHRCDDGIECIVFEKGDELIVVDLIYRVTRMPKWW